MPRQLADWSAGPNPLTVLLGSLVGCTQYTASMISQELKLGSLEGVAWKAAGPQSWHLLQFGQQSTFWQPLHKLDSCLS